MLALFSKLVCHREYRQIKVHILQYMNLVDTPNHQYSQDVGNLHHLYFLLEKDLTCICDQRKERGLA